MTFVNAGDSRHDLPRRTVAALERIMSDERLLHGMKRAVRLRQAFDCGDLLPLCHCSQRQAGKDPTTIDKNRAGATLAVVAALFCACQTCMLAKCIEQSRSRV